MSELRGKRPDYIPRVRSDIVAVVVGLVLYAVFLFGFHPYVLGIPVVWMLLLALGVFLTSALHLVAAVPSLKAKLKQRVGERAYGPVFGLASLVGIAIIVIGWRSSDFVFVYDPPEWGRYANYGLTLAAFICVGIFLCRGSLRQTLRFPMAIAAILWASGHLLANGDLASIILFGGFLTYAVLHIVIGTLNGVRPSPVVHKGHDLLSFFVGIALYGIMIQAHQALIGVPIVQLN